KLNPGLGNKYAKETALKKLQSERVTNICCNRANLIPQECQVCGKGYQCCYNQLCIVQTIARRSGQLKKRHKETCASQGERRGPTKEGEVLQAMISPIIPFCFFSLVFVYDYPERMKWAHME